MITSNVKMKIYAGIRSPRLVPLSTSKFVVALPALITHDSRFLSTL